VGWQWFGASDPCCGFRVFGALALVLAEGCVERKFNALLATISGSTDPEVK